MAQRSCIPHSDGGVDYREVFWFLERALGRHRALSMPTIYLQYAYMHQQ